MAKIGISFELSQNFSTDCLFEILKFFKKEDLNWYIIENQTEVWADSDGNALFLKKEYDSDEFFEVIAENHYAVFAKIQAFLISDRFIELHTAEDFINSNCKIIILICDSFWCDIYIKDISMIDTVYQGLIQNNFDNLTYIYDDNDKRTKLDVL